MLEEYSFSVKECGVYDCDEKWYWDCSGFKDYDLWAVFRGSASLRVCGEEIEVKAGSCVIIPPNAEIHGVQDPRNPLLVMSVHFIVFGDGIESFPFGLIHKSIVDVSFFRKLLERVVIGYNKSSEEANVWFRSAFFECMSCPDFNLENNIKREHIRYVNEVCLQINENAGAPKSLAEYAQQYGYSPTYFGKLFHRVVGVKFTQYLLNARINRAKLLLRTTDMSVSEIAYVLGYCDVCYFTRQFKSIVGCSPNSYR